MIKKIKETIGKIKFVAIAMICMVTSVYAEAIDESKLATGTKQLIEDVTSYMTGIGIAVTVLMVVYCLIRRNMADEMDHRKWQQRMTVSGISGIGIVVASSVINIIFSYYQ